MEYQFIIIDRLNVETFIEDPIGWDSTALTLKRDREKHGVFFDFQNNTFEYTGEAAKILRDEYEQYGIEGYLTLHIKYACVNGWESLYVGRFDFSQWEEEMVDCAVRLPVETTSDVMLFRNRIDQKVNLQTSLAFDESTVLPTYSKLPFTAELPSKSIAVANHAENNVDNSAQFHGEWIDDGSQPAGYSQMAFFVPEYNVKIAEEIGSFQIDSTFNAVHDETMTPSWTAPASWVELPYFDSSDPSFEPLDRYFPFESISPIINYDASLGEVHGNAPLTIDLEINYDRTIATNSVLGTSVTTGIRGWKIYLGILKKDGDPYVPTDWDWLSTSGLFQMYGNFASGMHSPLRGTFTYSHTLPLKPGDRVYFFEKLLYQKRDSLNGLSAFSITQHAGSSFKVSALSVAPASDCKLFMVNEAFSRIVEAITNDSLRVYSEFYGRTDSEPYAVSADGCGALRAVTQGLFIRQTNVRIPSRPTVYSLSFKDMWEGMNPIHNIGAGIETDPERAGYNCLRIEPWRYFYADDVVLECIGVSNVKRQIEATEHYSTFKFGYSRWEAEEYTGLDEFLTQREYRTTLTQVNNTLTKISQFIASGFAWEVTRRKGNATSEDWRYDKDTFITSMERSGSDLIVEIGKVALPDNIVDPDTIYNFRDRPSVMAMRWLPVILASYKQATPSSKIIFTDGTGNVYAEGYLDDLLCRTEDDIAISEKGDISPLLMADTVDGLPIWELETITYSYPLTVSEWKLLQANPKGKIYYEGEGVSGYGWIDTVTFKPEAGTAEFSLIPER